MFLQARAGPLKIQNLPPANPLTQQAQGRLWLTTALLKGLERDQDLPLFTPVPAVTLYRAQGRVPLKGLPQEEVPGHQDHHREEGLTHRDQLQGGEQLQPLQRRAIGDTNLCQGPSVSGRTALHQGTTGPSPSPLPPSSRRRKRRRSSCLPSLDCTGHQVPALPGCTPATSHQGVELHPHAKVTI